jgi:hypothetical protein
MIRTLSCVIWEWGMVVATWGFVLTGISIDGVQLCGAKRPRLLAIRVAREPTETPGAVEEPGRR